MTYQENYQKWLDLIFQMSIWKIWTKTKEDALYNLEFAGMRGLTVLTNRTTSTLFVATEGLAHLIESKRWKTSQGVAIRSR